MNIELNNKSDINTINQAWDRALFRRAASGDEFSTGVVARRQYRRATGGSGWILQRKAPESTPTLGDDPGVGRNIGISEPESPLMSADIRSLLVGLEDDPELYQLACSLIYSVEKSTASTIEQIRGSRSNFEKLLWDTNKDALLQYLEGARQIRAVGTASRSF